MRPGYSSLRQVGFSIIAQAGPPGFPAELMQNADHMTARRRLSEWIADVIPHSDRSHAPPEPTRLKHETHGAD